MKKIFFLLGLVFALGACSPSNERSAEEKTEDAIEEVGESAEEAGETIEEGVEDAGEAIEEGAEEVEDEVDGE